MIEILKGKVIRRITFSLLSSVIFLTGCWSSREVEDLAIITLIGLDRVTEGGVDKWQVSSKIFKPLAQKKDEVAKGTTEILVKGTGMTIQEADLEYLKRMPRFPFFGHMSSFVIGEEAAKESVEEVMSIHLAHVQDRPRSFLLVTKGEALDILGAEPELASTISKEITGIVEDKARKFGTAMGVTSVQFIECLLSQDRDAYLPQINLVYPDKEESEMKSIEIEGFGVFRGPKLVGWLSKEQATGFLFLCQKEITGASIIIPVQDGETHFTYTINISKTDVKPEMEEGKLSFTVNVQLKGTIWETGGIELTEENIKKEEEIINETIEKICMSTIKKAKELDSEFLGFMQKLHQVNPDAWQEVKEEWRETFQEAKIEVIVKSKVLNTGRMSKRLEIKE
ncbi:spore germination protein KC [Desulfosporosinus lacus DSM 15449]|uniref:Spore germination protein KC n=1 Tax=Desulfosporosinus lacus DSM 15449 TaxID=1121420 RepID=A0A1M6FHG9_9FIRM|nr:spore germination protein KC [Desulfosporosinus lacus DSM 15449]